MNDGEEISVFAMDDEKVRVRDASGFKAWASRHRIEMRGYSFFFFFLSEILLLIYYYYPNLFNFLRGRDKVHDMVSGGFSASDWVTRHKNITGYMVLALQFC